MVFKTKLLKKILKKCGPCPVRETWLLDPYLIGLLKSSQKPN